MLVPPVTIEEYKQIFAEILLSKTDKVSKISDGSVLNGYAYGVAKTGQRLNKDIAILEANLFPDAAFGSQLDQVAANFGVPLRFAAAASSTYLRLVASPGTQYTPGVHTFKATDGSIFELDAAVTVPNFGYTYAKVHSQSTGLKANVPALSIKTVTPIPVGHIYCINEFKAENGRDIEDDASFRQRIKNSFNICATGTLSKLEQVFIKINSNVLKAYYNGMDVDGKVVIAVATVNGVDLSGGEINQLLTDAAQYLSLTELAPWSANAAGLKIINATYFPIDVSYRVDLDSSYDIDVYRAEVQQVMSKYLDFRFWPNDKLVDWEELLFCAEKHPAVRYLPDQYFYPRVDMLPASTVASDVSMTRHLLPRVRGFLIMDVDGNILSNLAGTLNPIFYPNRSDFIYQATVLRSI